MRDKELRIIQEAYRELRPRAPLPKFELEFCPFANVNSTVRVRQGKLSIRISDLLEGAPPPVFRAIVHILLAKLYRRRLDPLHAARYRRHVSSPALAKRAQAVRQLRGRKRITSAQGRTYDLHEVFDDLNRHYFYGLLGRPRMSWAAAASRVNLGHYDPAHNTIVISRIFDHPGMPRFAVEYLVYHEMLHLKYPVRLRGSRRCIHSSAFQAEEKRFPHFADAKRFLRGL